MQSATPEVFLLPVWPPPLSLATTRGISVDFFSSPYLDVSVREVPRVYLCIQYTLRDSSSRGFPHSDICGSKLICSSPQLFAACHVLLRLLMPRHSPYALLSLNSFVYLPIYSFSLSLELLCITFFSCFSISLWQNCFFYPLERPDFLIYFKISSFSLFA